MSDSELVKKMVRAVLQSSKDGVLLLKLQVEYRLLCGEDIPFRKLGYSKLEGYLRSIPSVVRLEYRMGQLMCFGVACKDTAHVAELVARQKSSKKSVKTQVINCKMRFQPSNPYLMNVWPRTSLRQPSAYGGSRGMSASGDYRQFDKRFSTITPVQRREPTPQSPVKQCVIPESEVKSFQNKIRLAERSPEPASTLASTKLGLYDVELEQSRITRVLEKYSSGLWLSKLSKFYSEMFNQDLHPQVLIDLETWTDICMVEPLRTNQASRLIYPPLPPKPVIVPLNITTNSSPVSAPSSPEPPSTPPILTHKPSRKSPLAKPTFIFPPNPTAVSSSRSTSPVTSQSPNRTLTSSPQRAPFDSTTVSVNGGCKDKRSLPSGALPLSPTTTSGTTNSSAVSPSQPSQKLSSSSPASQSCTTVSPELLQRIEELLSKYSQGIWAHALPKLFMDTYKTPFPQHILDNLTLLCNIWTVDYPLPLDKSKAILYKTNRADEVLTESQLSQRNPLPSGVEVFGSKVPPSLVRPKEQYPSVLVSEANSTTSVTIRYVGKHYSNAQEAMEDMMQSFYSQSSSRKPLINLSVGQLVAVKGEGGDEWARAQIQKIISPDKAKVYYMDHGFSVEASRSNLLELHGDFLSLPFQATNVKLSGLEAFSSHPSVLSHLENLAVGKILLMETLDPDTEETPAVVVYDTSQDSDININSSCLKVLQDNTMNNLLKENAVYKGVRVTDVCADGSLYCQLPSRGTARLAKLLDETEAYFLSQMTSDSLVSRPFNGKFCLARYKEKWARAEIISMYDNRIIEILFVDMGITATVEVTDLREIPSRFLTDFTIIPPQATKCQLADLTDAGHWTQEVFLKVKETVQGCDNCKIKISTTQKHKEEQLVCVYLYVGDDGHRLHESINQWLAKSEMWEKLPSQINNTVLSNRMDTGERLTPSSMALNPTTKALAPPVCGGKEGPAGPTGGLSCKMPPPLELPQPGENMDIHVPMACHPGYFVVQRWDQLHKLVVLTGEMMLYYNQIEKTSTNPPITKGELYAVKVERNWHRAVVKDILARGWVSIYELDQGKHELVRSTAIQPLMEEFRQLPFQALPAQLAGVAQRQWSEEASILFRNYVEKKALVARVESVQPGKGDPWERRLSVFLADTTNQEEDLWIHTVIADIDSFQAA